MADRYQDKPFTADDDDDRGTQRAPAKGESDPLAELARLIGQTDPFSNFGRANQPMPPRETDPYQRPEPEPEPEVDEGPTAGRPSWMQRAAQQEAAPQLDFDTSVHPLRRYAAAHPPAEPEYHEAPPFAADADQHVQADPARYDDALYGQPDPGTYDAQQQDTAYADDPYAYQDGYGEEAEDQKPRRGGMITVVAVLALAVIGTGGAFAYRTYMGLPRGGEPPIIRADAGPTKIVPAPSGDGVAKVPDRMAPGGAEKIVPREEAPVDVNAGPRQVFPPLNQNTNPPTAAIVPPAAKPPAAPAASGTLAGDEPRKIRTLAVKGDPVDVAATPAPKPATTPRPVPSPAAARAPAPSPAANANASANAPLSLSPQAAPAAPADTRTRVASSNATQAAPGGGGSYVVQVSSQRSEADAQASYRALQGKFPSVLGSRSPLIKRADLGDKGVYYRAMVGPFTSSEEAAQVCGNLKTAGGQCVVQKN
jgi:SPOR domain